MSLEALGTLENVESVFSKLAEPAQPIVSGTVPSVTASRTRSQELPGVAVRTLVSVITARSREPWIGLNLGENEIASVRPGGIVSVAGPTGSGKTSLAVQIVAEHARSRPAVYLSVELPADEVAGRIIGMTCGRSWRDVLCGDVHVDEMMKALNLNLQILDRREANISELTRILASLRHEDHTSPILVAIDYVQILGAGGDTRTRISDLMAEIDDVLREYRAVCLVVSQTSRMASRELREGARLGAATTDVGAESSAIERYASVTLALGAALGVQGTSAIHVGKCRMGGGDKVIPATFDGLSGLWQISGPEQSGTALRKNAKRDHAKAKEAEIHTKLIAVVDSSDEPLSRDEIGARVGIRGESVSRGVRFLLGTGQLVEVQLRRPQSSHNLIWTPRQAEKNDIPVVGVTS